MANSPASSHPVLGEHIRSDLKRKQALLSAACRCLDDEQAYLFVQLLASLARLAPGERDAYLSTLPGAGVDVEKLRRLVEEEGATAFKALVDLVWEIRVRQEIDAMIQ